MSRAGRPRAAVVGTGRLARVLGPLLAERGYPVVAVAGRRPHASRELCRSIPGAVASGSIGSAARRAELILLAVPDRRIAPVARELARARRVDWSRRTVLHHAGALGPEVLDPLRAAGAEVGLLHPLQVLGDPTRARRALAGSRCRIEGTAGAVALARRLARDLRLVPLDLGDRPGPEARVAYHAAASLMSNDLLALLAIAADLLGSSGIERREAIAALAPLARGALDQALRSGLGAALTGPVVRGDAETLARHLRLLSRLRPGDSRAHRELSLRLLELAGEEGRPLPPAGRRRLECLLGARGGGRRRGPTV